jgi:methionine biosynthesis protein MetW
MSNYSKDIKWLTKPFSLVRELVHLIFTKKMPLEEIADYDEYWTKRDDLKIIVRFKYIANDLPNKGTLLDIGCGDGTFLNYLKKVKPEIKTVGIDVSTQAIQKVKDKGLEGYVLNIAKEQLPTNMKFDYICIMEVLEHIHDAEEVTRAVKKLNAKRYYITIPNLGDLSNRLRLAIGGKMPLTMIIFHIREHIRFWTHSDFKHWAKTMGLDIIKYHGQGGFPFLWKIWPTLFARQMIYVLEDSKN